MRQKRFVANPLQFQKHIVRLTTITATNNSIRPLHIHLMRAHFPTSLLVR